MCISYVNCWNQTVRAVGLSWVSKFKAVKEHQQAQALHVSWLEGPAAEEVILQCWGMLELHFSLR